ncbi:hypothetical protein [Streptomyces sp. NPDC094049]|uniref:hypothetical protein n=1 Tax=Streptomyces sp. NPDC094049 TaxID=3154987 RepID=UPI00333367B6
MTRSSSGTNPAAAVLHSRHAGRLPSSLASLTGPDHGTVALPPLVAWSGLRAYDLDRPRLRMGIYRTVLAEGQREDLTPLLDRGRLLDQWPVLRTLVSRHLRQAWEGTFPGLGTAKTAS